MTPTDHVTIAADLLWMITVLAGGGCELRGVDGVEDLDLVHAVEAILEDQAGTWMTANRARWDQTFAEERNRS